MGSLFIIFTANNPHSVPTTKKEKISVWTNAFQFCTVFSLSLDVSPRYIHKANSHTSFKSALKCFHLKKNYIDHPI